MFVFPMFKRFCLLAQLVMHSFNTAKVKGWVPIAIFSALKTWKAFCHDQTCQCVRLFKVLEIGMGLIPASLHNMHVLNGNCSFLSCCSSCLAH